MILTMPSVDPPLVEMVVPEFEFECGSSAEEHAESRPTRSLDTDSRTALIRPMPIAALTPGNDKPPPVQMTETMADILFVPLNLNIEPSRAGDRIDLVSIPTYMLIAYLIKKSKSGKIQITKYGKI